MHAGHGLHIYKKKHHFFIALGVLLLPALILFLIGGLNHIQTGNLLLGITTSLVRLAVAYAISLIIGVTVAILVGYSPWGNSIIPVFDVLQNVPSFALIPVFALIFGYTNMMAIVFAATSIIWPIVFYVLNAIKTARTELNEAATIFGATGIKRIFYYLLPLSFPAIVTSSIVGVSIGWETVIGVEIIGLSNGIGVFLGGLIL